MTVLVSTGMPKNELQKPVTVDWIAGPWRALTTKSTAAQLSRASRAGFGAGDANVKETKSAEIAARRRSDEIIVLDIK